jgi:amino acid transporter
MSFNLSATNDEAAALTAFFVAASAYFVADEPIKTVIGAAILAAGAVLGYTGYSSTPAAAPAAKAA